MRQNELEDLLVELTPDEIRVQRASELTEENKTFLAAFEGFDRELGKLGETYIESFPAAPVPQTGSAGDQPKVLHKYGWTIRMPFWAASITVAAVLLLGFLAIFSPGKGDPPPGSDIFEALGLTRSEGNDDGLKDHNDRLIKALLDRGFFFFEKGTESGYRQALSHFQLAYQIDPQNQRSIKYLILASEALGKDADTRRWHRELEALENSQKLPQP